MRPGPDVTVIDLNYLAPVPAGHDVLILTLARTDPGFWDTAEAACVVDQASGIVYADRHYLSVLEQNKTGEIPTSSPAGALGPEWSVTNSLVGQVVAAVMGTTDTMKTNYSRTRLYLRSKPPEGYR